MINSSLWCGILYKYMFFECFTTTSLCSRLSQISHRSCEGLDFTFEIGFTWKIDFTLAKIAQHRATSRWWYSCDQLLHVILKTLVLMNGLRLYFKLLYIGVYRPPNSFQIYQLVSWSLILQCLFEKKMKSCVHLKDKLDMFKN